MTSPPSPSPVNIPAWVAIGITLLSMIVGAFAKFGAQEQRIVSLEARTSSLEQSDRTKTQAFEEGLSHVSADVSYIRGRIDFLSTALADVRKNSH